jgi:hypothetical protein
MSYVAVGVGLAMMVAGTAINYENQQQAANRADRIQAQEIEQQTALQKKANQDTQQMLQKDAANNNDQSQRSQLLNSFQAAIKANQGTATGGLNQVGNVSSAYTKAANDASLGVSQYADSQANSLASMGAPALQRQNENAALANYGSQIGAINQESAADQGLANIKLRGVQANPWLAAIGQGLSSAGRGVMGGMMTGGGTPTAGDIPTNPYTGSGTGAVMYSNGNPLSGYGVNMPY